MWKHILVQGCYQLFWMFLCLYALPTLIPKYEITSKSDFYESDCIPKLEEKYTWNATYSDFQCGVMRFCGFPYNESMRNTPDCPLYANFWSPNSVPGNQKQAMCNSTSVDCQANKDLGSAKDYMSNEYEDQVADDYLKATSVLFNAFIMCQVANEVNSRRINDEYNVFEGLHKSPIFLGVLTITIGLQAIIINFLGLFFKVVPLNWEEWLACIAIGLGAFPVSFLTRWLTHVINRCRGVEGGQAQEIPELLESSSSRKRDVGSSSASPHHMVEIPLATQVSVKSKV